MTEKLPEILVAESRHKGLTSGQSQGRDGREQYAQAMIEALEMAGPDASWEDPEFVKEVEEILSLPSPEREQAFVRFALLRGK